MLNEPQERVGFWLRKRDEQAELTQEVEQTLMSVLWDLRGHVKVDEMIRWTGWSKQTLYNKWAKYGFKEHNENNRTDKNTQA